MTAPVGQDAKPLPQVAVKPPAQESSVNGRGINGPTVFVILGIEPFLQFLFVMFRYV